jgi:hypothetical protein
MRKESPNSKIWEALSALADNRVEKISENEYHVTSSDYSKAYTVIVEKETYSSNDNATYWQHYAGYPILAVWMLEKKAEPNADLLPLFANIPWKALNTKYKNKYELSIGEAEASFTPENKEKAETEVARLASLFTALPLSVKGNRCKILSKTGKKA